MWMSHVPRMLNKLAWVGLNLVNVAVCPNVTGRVKCEVVTELCGETREIVGYVSLEFRGLAEDRR